MSEPRRLSPPDKTPVAPDLRPAPFSDSDISAAIAEIRGDEIFVKLLIGVFDAFEYLREGRFPDDAETLQDLLHLFSRFSDRAVRYPVGDISARNRIFLMCLCRFGFLEAVEERPTIDAVLRVPSMNYQAFHVYFFELLRHLRIIHVDNADDADDVNASAEVSWIAVNHHSSLFAERLLQLLRRMRQEVPQFQPHVRRAIAAICEQVRDIAFGELVLAPEDIN